TFPQGEPMVSVPSVRLSGLSPASRHGIGADNSRIASFTHHSNSCGGRRHFPHQLGEGESTMSTGTKVGPEAFGSSDLASLRGAWRWLLSTGISSLLLGRSAFCASFFGSLATRFVFGLLGRVGAFLHAVTAFWGRQWRGFFLHLLTGILYLIAGVFMLE